MFQIGYSLDELNLVVRRFWQTAENFHIIAFHGEMGAGKTTFISALCNELNVEDKVSSPTFSLINEYHFFDNNGRDKIVYHIDLFRVKDKQEVEQSGIAACFHEAVLNNDYCFVEWYAKAEDLLPKPFLLVSFEPTDETERKITIAEIFD